MASAVGALSSRTVVVTGANKGIGYCIAEQLRDSGDFGRVVLACRSEERGRAAVAALGGAPCEFVATLDLASEASIDAFVAALEASSTGGALPRCDGLVNNAGTAFKAADPTPFAAQTGPTLAVNYWGTVRLTDKLLPLISASGERPFVVSVASMAGRLGQIKDPSLRDRFSSPDLTREELDGLVKTFEADVAAGRHQERGWGSSNYGFSKLALIAYTKLVARETAAAKSPVRVNCFCPGYCDTDMTSHKGPRSPSEGAKNAVLLVERALGDDVNGAFVQNGALSAW